MNFLNKNRMALAAAACLALSACSSAPTQDMPNPSVVENPSFAAGSTMAKIAESGSIRIGTKFDQPPVGQKNLRGELEGYDIEIAKIIASKLGLTPEDITWVETVSANREPFVQQGKVDMVTAYYAITEKRREAVGFAGPYLIGGLDLMVLAGNPHSIEGPEDSAGKKVCGVGGSTGASTMREEYPETKLVEFDVLSKCAEALKQGQVDAVVQADAVLLGIMEKEPGTFELVDKQFSEERFGIGFTKGDTEFCEFITDTLKEAEENGTYQQAWVSTIGKAAGKDTAPPLGEFDSCN